MNRSHKMNGTISEMCYNIIGKEGDSVKQHILRLCSVLLCATLALSFVCVALQLEHDCTGEDCPICLLIDQSRVFQSSLLWAGFLALSSGLIRLRSGDPKNTEGQCACQTLFDRKTELLD